MLVILMQHVKRQHEDSNKHSIKETTFEHKTSNKGNEVEYEANLQWKMLEEMR